MQESHSDEFDPAATGSASDDEMVLWGVARPGQAASAVRSVAECLETLGRLPLLTSTQLKDLPRLRLADPRALAKALLQRGWLTPYQANQLLQGRGGELVLGSYLLLERLGTGGTGVVFKARHQKLQRVAAVKLIRPELLSDAEVVARFYREIQLLSRINHPHVVLAYDAGPIGRTHFLAMEYIDGIDLTTLVKRSGPLPVGQACEYIRQAALGLQSAHEHRLTHRDIKPSNLLLSMVPGPSSANKGAGTKDQKHVIKVLDLGLARIQRNLARDRGGPLTEEQANLTLTPAHGVMMGTPDYIAPEQAVDFRQADIRSDIYSLGCTLYFLLRGQPPFAGGTVVQKLLKHQQAEPEPLAKYRTDVPESVNAMLRRAMAKDPAQRYQTPQELADALQTLLAGKAPAKGKAVAVAPPSSPSSRRKRSRWVVALAAIALVPLLLWLLSPNGGPGGAGVPASPIGPVPSGGNPLDQLSAAGIAPGNRFAGQPPELVAVIGTSDSAITALTLRPDSRVVATAHEDRKARTWSVAEGKIGPVAEPPVGETGPLLAVAYSPTGQYLALGWSQCHLHVREAQTNRLLSNRRVWFEKQAGFAFSADGKELFVAGRSALRVVDMNLLIAGGAPRPEKTLTECSDPEGPSYHVACANNGRWLAWGGARDGALRVWDRKNQREQHILKNGQPVLALAFSPGSRLLATNSSHSIRLWQVESGQSAAGSKDTQGRVTTLAFAPDGRRLAAGTDQGEVVLWEMPQDQADKGLLRHPDWSAKLPGAVAAICFAPDSRHLFTGNANGRVYVLRLDRNP
jgi:serine/threonine protein kinase